jgi:putative DNA primase/helicase
MVGKTLAIIPDARLDARGAQAAVERFLTISGEDHTDVDRKHKDPLAGVKLKTRIMMATNEVPKLADTSGALASRFLILRLVKSFLGNEDRQLEAKLMAELPGIFLWAQEGWKSLRLRGHFVQPNSAAEDVKDMKYGNNPLQAFVYDENECKIGSQFTVSTQRFRERLSEWWTTMGISYPCPTAVELGRKLRAIVPELGEVKIQEGSKRVRGYQGISLVRDLSGFVQVDSSNPDTVSTVTTG